MEDQRTPSSTETTELRPKVFDLPKLALTLAKTSFEDGFCQTDKQFYIASQFYRWIQQI